MSCVSWAATEQVSCGFQKPTGQEAWCAARLACLLIVVSRHVIAGTVIGCLRKLQRWNLTAIFEEYRRYAGSKVRLLNEQASALCFSVIAVQHVPMYVVSSHNCFGMQFIELFDTDLVKVPLDHPAWL